MHFYDSLGLRVAPRPGLPWQSPRSNVQAQFRLEQTGKNDLPSSVVISSSASEVAIEGRRILGVKHGKTIP